MNNYGVSRFLSVAALLMAFTPISGLAQEHGEMIAGEMPQGKTAHMVRLKDKPNEPWQHQMMQNDLQFDQSKSYTLTFWAKGTPGAQGHVSTKINQPPWGFFGLRNDFVLHETWHRYRLNFSAAGSIPDNNRLTFNFQGTSAMEMRIADVSITQRGGDDTNMIENGKFEYELRDWRLNGHGDGNYSVAIESIESDS